MKKCESICIHVRRGDYVGSIHEVCSVKYYEKCINEISKNKKNIKFYVFSDDIGWCKENLDFKGKNVDFIYGNKNYEDLRLMYSCKNFIISNSTFSWWAQYLCDNKNKIVYAPKKWFNNNWNNPNLYMKEWRLIDV